MVVSYRDKQTELPRYNRMVSVAEIASPSDDHNLNNPHYISR